MNRHQLEGAWHELKGKAKKQWGKLTDDELGTMKGRFEELSGSLQKHYGYTKEEAEKDIDKFLEKQ